MSHLSRHHRDIWDAHVEDRQQKKIAKVQRKEKEVANCEMQNAELRFTDLRSNAKLAKKSNLLYFEQFWGSSKGLKWVLLWF